MPSIDRGNILVTGGAGYIGSHVAKGLRQHGWLPVAYDNLSRGHRELVRWGPLEVGDVLDYRRLLEVMTRYRPVAVVHLAAFAYVGESTEDPIGYATNNIAGSSTLLRAMQAAGIRRIIFSSTCSVYGDRGGEVIDESTPPAPMNPYAWSKLAVEQLLAHTRVAHGLEYVALRYFNAAGADPDGETGECHDPEPHLIPTALAAAAGTVPGMQIFGTDHPTFDGTCIRDFVHVSDIADAHRLALDHLLAGRESQILNLGNGRGYSVREVIAIAEAVAGRPIACSVGPRRPGDPSILVADSRLAREVLGWEPRHDDLRQQIEHAWRWMTGRAASMPGLAATASPRRVGAMAGNGS